MEWLRKILGMGAGAIGKITGATQESRKQQAELNAAEISGAPKSALRLWRSFLGFTLCAAFVWEVIVRPVITTYWPGVTLPPSFLDEVTGVLMGMLGLGL